METKRAITLGKFFPSFVVFFFFLVCLLAMPRTLPSLDSAMHGTDYGPHLSSL
jgi:hypothetical protein